MTIKGQATGEGTRRYQKRQVIKDNYRPAGDLHISTLGIGTYLGDPDDSTDQLVTEAVRESVRGGVNLIDTAINYRYLRAEKCVGAALQKAVEAGEVQRDEIVVCTKGGFVPTEEDPSAWFDREYLKKHDDIQKGDLVADCHCMHPAYLADQLEQSRSNLGLETIDVYYLHNPETQLRAVKPKLFSDRLRAAFEALERACDQGKIACYGLATWNAFRVPPDQRDFMNLADIKKLAKKAVPKGTAKSAAGKKPDRLRFVQLPFNLAMPEALLATQKMGKEEVPVLEAARQLKIEVVSSASICQGQIIGKIPDALGESLGRDLTDAQRALQFTRSTPGLTSALVGMKAIGHVKENLALVKMAPLETDAYLASLQSAT
jgi:aryl-alcohol dehydrogenase-like predicted oxidoreductase